MDNFIVSARKYRPATFVSVVGQRHITSTLQNAITRGQLAHAYLFCGPRGVGKTTCARIFAKAINCLSPRQGEACNECESCMSFNEGRSFNIHELDAASNNSVDDIRSLTDQVRIPPQIGRYSVYIIDEVHMLSLQAFNAFLKTLEEPPAHAVFILATTEKHKIIPTILSRCQIYDFNRIRVEDSVEYIKYIASQEGITFDEESLHVIARKADGGMRDALSMFDKVVSFCGSDLRGAEVAATLNVLDYETYFTVTDHILKGDYISALLAFDDVLSRGFSSQNFIAGLNTHLRDLLMCKNPQTIPLLEVSGGVADRFKAQADRCEVQMLIEGINLLTSIDSGLRTATNQRLNVELGLMKLAGLGQKKNDGVSADTLTFSLPALTGRCAGKTSTKTEPAAIAAKESEPAAPVGKPVAGPVFSETIAASVPKPSVATGSASVDSQVAEQAATETAVPAPDIAEPAAPTFVSAEPPISAPTPPVPSEKKPTGIISLSGRSLSSILGAKHPVEEQEKTDEDLPEEEIEIDEMAEEKLIKSCELYSREIIEQRPRIGIVIAEAEVNGNTVSLKVPNESSYDEIMRNLSEIRRSLAQLSGLRMPIEFDVRISDDTKSLRPVKIEDRLRHLTEKNPLLNDLRAALDMDPE